MITLWTDVPADFQVVAIHARSTHYSLAEVLLFRETLSGSRRQIGIRVVATKDVPDGVLYELLDRDEVDGSPGEGYRRRVAA